ncbi:hypothetical protein P152DRAFT_192051 [Eremomyces bilateralis CBS 781.70]|uniref:FluG domain-containing protein n=1 Tax=Eremomyces bilateralis CBS 781.70 TaxID=1392243 RepID=A0A6G1GCM2_9PEZI|nr:uncharacterized protein P152DRAFT_192051 [Eremomyces bilateralis CBS 781.70]KAF1815641.1 hypothetical protein P152DRAFT_192051 [Eremomyces bilateralis CBS 781.70]
MGRRNKSHRGAKKDTLRDAAYYESLYTDDLTPALRPITDATERGVRSIWGKWTEYVIMAKVYQVLNSLSITLARYCSLRILDPDALTRLQNISVAEIQRFMHWYLDSHAMTKLSSLYVLMRYWLMMYARKLYQRLDLVLVSDMKDFIGTVLKGEYSLSEGMKDNPVTNVDDVYLLLYHHYALSNEYYAHERERVQHSLIILFMIGTSARPSTLVERGGYYNTNECLKYMDIEIFKVRNPELPSQQVFIMRVRLRLLKGKRDKGLPIKVVFCVRDDNLAFCTILQVLSLAFADNAFESDWIKRPKDLYTFSVPFHLQSVQLHWKESMQDIPIFRRSVARGGEVAISPDRSVQYMTPCYQNARLGKSAGIADTLGLYSYHRGAGESIDCKCTISLLCTFPRRQFSCVAGSDMRSFVMGHARASLFERYYRNSVVQFDSVSAFLEVPSKDALIKLAGHMSLTRDPSAADSIKVENSAIDRDRSIQQIQKLCLQLRKNPTETFGKIKNGAGTELYEKYQSEQRHLRNERMRLKRELEEEARRQYFRTAGTRYIDEQRRGIAREYIEPKPVFQFEERERLAALLFQNRDVREVSEEELYTQRIAAMDNLINLCGRHMTRPAPRRHLSLRDKSLEEVSEEKDVDPDLFPLVCPGTQCLFCLGNQGLGPQSRTFAFS